MDFVEINLRCALCGEQMRRSKRLDRDGKVAFVCDSPHRSTPVLLSVQFPEVDQEPVEA